MGMMSPLASLVVLAFLFMIVVAMLVWALLQPRGRGRAHAEPPPTAPPLPRRESSLTNDDVRGAKAVPKRGDVPDDPFERFLRAGDDERR